jgi:hypothetical protein
MRKHDPTAFAINLTFFMKNNELYRDAASVLQLVSIS